MTAAIHTMRRMEACLTDSGRRRSQMIEECRQVLGAVSVSLCHLRQDGELVFLNVAGSAPGAEAVREIVVHASRRRKQWFSDVISLEPHDVAIAGRGSDAVCAVLPRPAEPWVEDFVTFMAERFLHCTGDRIPAAAASPEPPHGLILPPEMIVGSSRVMRVLLDQMRATVASGLDVLLTGETGTGKEMLARIVHDSGPMRGGPFIAINCAAIPGELLEAELFGVQRRVATGVDPRKGLFIEADRGSIFLDEIGELPERLQAKLLRVLQEREVLALGAVKPTKIAVRVISASNRDLASLVAEGRFRADLYYRLRGLEFSAPPLRERPEDIAALAIEFLARANEQYGRQIAGITQGALERLQKHSWPGNVRELQTEVRRAVLLCESGGSLRPEHFPSLKNLTASRAGTPTLEPVIASASPVEDPDESLRERIDSIERTAIEDALQTSGGNQSLAARILGITRNGLAHKLRRLGIAVPCRRRTAPVLRKSPRKEANNAQ